MDFEDTAEEAAYRARVRDWLRNEPPPPEAGHWVRADGTIDLTAAKAWQSRKAGAGYASISWPTTWGGAGGTMWQAVIFSQEEAAFIAPHTPFDVGLGICLPTIMTCGSPEDRARFGRPAVRGDEIWCQLFSEPGSGSDLAGARTRAVRDGQHWIIDGQKVWTSHAHYADFGLLLARTDPARPKHKGLTMFWMDMKSAGVEVRRIRQMSGGASFNEVFMSGVRVPDVQRVGAVGDGWRTSLVTLMNERMAIGEGAAGAGWREVLRMAANLPALPGRALDDHALREKIADWYVRSEGLRHLRSRALTAFSRGQTPGPENSIGKVVWAPLMQEIANAAIDLQGPLGMVNSPMDSVLSGLCQDAFLKAPGLRIAGGTDEILRNVIADRVLGLPPDIRVDKDVPFQEIPVGS